MLFIVKVSPVSDHVQFALPLSSPLIVASPVKEELPSVLVRAKSTGDCNFIVPEKTAELFDEDEPSVIEDVVPL